MEEGEESQYLTSFCRIIMPSVVRQHKLVLPRKFVDEYGDQLSNTVRLELPVVVVVVGGGGGGDKSSIWHIGLRKSEGLIFLEDGFEKFMEHFSVGFGKCLLFKYKGNSVFNLHIFDLTAMEIDYGHGFDSGSSGKRLMSDARNVKKEINDESIVSETLVVGSSKRKFGFTESTPRNKQNEILARSEGPMHIVPTDKESRRLSISRSEEETGRNQGKERARALNDVKMYKTDNPSCVVQIRQSTIANSLLHLPTKFCEDNMNDLVVEHFDLQDSDNRSWRVRCWKDRSRFNLGKGMSQFIKDKKLQTGDVCVFEILCKCTLKVSIFPAK